MVGKTSAMCKTNKKLFGQFFTTTNPFVTDAFFKWIKLIPNLNEQVFLEPFAGSNNIVKMIQDIGYKNDWRCFDIAPNTINIVSEYSITKQDTLKNYPKNFSVAITNPPYLAKNSATRSGMPFPQCRYDDVYKYALQIMLDNTDFVAVIIPDSFITSDLFRDRLYAVVSLNCRMFQDTDCPVCLSLFVPPSIKQNCSLQENDFFVYISNFKIGKYNTIMKNIFKEHPKYKVDWRFNDPKGSIGIRCIDNSSEASIEFLVGDEISEDKIKCTSRSLTRVSGLPVDIDVNLFVSVCNNKLETLRATTYDIALTSFKGLRKDCFYRKRLDYTTARKILNTALYEVRNL